MQIKRLMLKELSEGKYCVNYRICETDYKLLSKSELVNYLNTQPVPNMNFLKEINSLVVDIIELWNGDFQKLDKILFDEPYVYVNEEKQQLLNTVWDFHCIVLTDDKWRLFNSTDYAKTSFLTHYDSNHYQIAHIVNKCLAILDWIFLHYPETFDKKDNKLDSNLKDRIKEFFVTIDTSGWKYVFSNEQDFNKLIGILVQHFDSKKLNTLTSIKVKTNCKTKLALMLKEIHKEFGSTKLKQDTQFFEIIKSISIFKNEADLYKTISR